MERAALLRTINFGERVAEDETGELAKYFVETDQWTRIFDGQIDVVRGEKGAGKSAIYSLLIARSDKLFFGEFYLRLLNVLAARQFFMTLLASLQLPNRNSSAFGSFILRPLLAKNLERILE